MYSYEDRKRAVELYIQYNLSAAAVIRELGHPDRHSLPKWYKEFKNDGDLRKQRIQVSKFTPEQRKTAVDYYLTHGMNMNKTIKALGYPGRATLSRWLSEDCPDKKRYCKYGAPKVICLTIVFSSVVIVPSQIKSFMCSVSECCIHSNSESALKTIRSRLDTKANSSVSSSGVLFYPQI